MAEGWRTALRGYLAERQGQKITFAELLLLFGEQIPLHHATRMWLVRTTRGKPNVLDTPNRMRRHTLVGELHGYPLKWLAPVRLGRPIEDADVLVPLTRECVHCGTPYFAQLVVPSCGRTCARKAAWVRWRAARGKEVSRRHRKAEQAIGGPDGT